MTKDHPRRCGENKEVQKISAKCAGSPPQVRGKHEECYEELRAARITPAGAGKTHNRKNSIKEREDHPRRCGENNTVLSRRA